MSAWVALNIVIFGLIDLAKKNVSSIISEVSCHKNSVVSRFFIQNSTYIFQLQICWIVEGGCMVFSCFSSRMCSEIQMTAELLKLEPLKMLNSFKMFFLLEIKPCELGSRIRDVEAFWYKTDIKIIYFVQLCLIALIVCDCMVYPDPNFLYSKLKMASFIFLRMQADFFFHPTLLIIIVTL